MTELTHEAEAITLKTSVIGEQNIGKIEIPDYAIERFAKFLLPKIRASLKTEKQKAG